MYKDPHSIIYNILEHLVCARQRCTMYVLIHLSLTTISSDRYSQYIHFTSEKTKATAN